MDAQRFKDAFEKLEMMDARLTHKVRPKEKLLRPSPDQLELNLRDVQAYVVELKEVLREVLLAIGSKG